MSLAELAEKLRVEADAWLLPEDYYPRDADYLDALCNGPLDAVAKALKTHGLDRDQLEAAITALEEACLAHHLATAEDV